MSSEAKIKANTLNAHKSTGPITRIGKSRSKSNAATHGIYSVSPILPGECPEIWNQFRSETLIDLRPVGALEVALAERITFISWKQKRLAAHEVAISANLIKDWQTRNPGQNATFRQLESELNNAEYGKKSWQASSALACQSDGILTLAVIKGYS